MNLYRTRFRSHLLPVINTYGIKAVVWIEQGPDTLYRTLTKQNRVLAATQEGVPLKLEVRTDDPADIKWTEIAEVAFRLNTKAQTFRAYVNATNVFESQFVSVDITLGDLRCMVAKAKHTQLMVVAPKGHEVTKSLTRLVRNAVKRLDGVHITEEMRS